MKYLGIDIGGTWIKASVVDEQVFKDAQKEKLSGIQIRKVKSPLHAKATVEELLNILKEIIALFRTGPEQIKCIGISTAGIVNYQGNRVIKAAGHINVLKIDSWGKELEDQLQCPSVVINDSDAATIALAETGYFKGNKTVGIMPVGTGIGFTVWRNGRRWRPGKNFTLLGSIRTRGGLFDSIGSATNLASLDEKNNLITVLTNDFFEKERELYFQDLINIINTAAILYNLDEVVICGGLADASEACDFPLEQLLNKKLYDTPVELEKSINVVVAKEGNKLQLMGALALAHGESVAVQNRVIQSYKALDTEIPYSKDIRLENMDTPDIIETLWQAEQEAGDMLESSLPIISDVARKAVKKIKDGGRIIYVGAGTSGRVAAMDAVEVPCTFGFPEDRIMSVIAGGISDAAIEIESDFEEDASAVPEMLFLNLQTDDVVIGISASGSAYYVQSALALAKNRGALSVLVQAGSPGTELPYCNYIISLNSGNEVVAGSTRMKAGTATKKVLNFLSSSIMISLGKVAGSYMVDVACINNKLVQRAQEILNILYGINSKDALDKLQKEDFNLNRVIQKIQSNK